MKNRMICAVQLMLLVLFAAGTAHAVPAFTRAHKVECTTCHTIAPELNEYGDAFLKNSYVYVGKAKKGEKKEAAAPAPAAPKQAAAGAASLKINGEGDADKLSKLKAGAMGADAPEQTASAAEPAAATVNPGDPKSEGLALAAIPEIIPISFTGSINYGFGDQDNTRGNHFDQSARSFKLHAAGNFRDTIGFFATYAAYSEQPTSSSSNTSEMPSNNKTDLNEFFVQWKNMFETPVNIKIGRMQPKLGLWKTNNKLSATNNYLPYTYTVGQQSVFRVEQPQDALEINSVLAKRLYLAAGMVNRKNQSGKEGYGHISYKYGGVDYMGNEPDVDLSKEENFLDFLTVTVGTYGYYGENGPSTIGSNRNIYGRTGLDAELQYKVLRLRMLAGWGIDDNVAPTQAAYWPTVISKTASFEGEYTILTNLITAGRFEYLQEKGGDGIPSSVFHDYYNRRYIATLGYTPLENFKLSTEFKYEVVSGGLDTINNVVPRQINRIGYVGATFSF